MGMFDRIESKPFADNFGVGENFVLTGASLVENVTTEFGKGTMCVLTINDEQFTLFGKGIENQIRAMEDGDLPARVKLARIPAKVKGRDPMKVLVPANTPLSPDHFVIDPANAPQGNGDNDIPF